MNEEVKTELKDDSWYFFKTSLNQLIRSADSSIKEFEKLKIKKDQNKKQENCKSYKADNEKTPEYFEKIEKLKKYIINEYKKFGFSKQINRDVKLWRLTLNHPGNDSRKGLLRRIFLTLRYGNFLFSSKEGEWKYWSQTNWPIATALSHGGRILIQTPLLSNSLNDKERDHTFWNWLITGSIEGDLSKFVSTLTTGDEAENEDKILFKRLAATHSIDYKDKNNIEIINGEVQKNIYETKTMGFNFRDTKVFSNEDHSLQHHRHWGFNIPLGGHDQESFLGEKISANGEYGHFYLYYMSPSSKRNGGILIGLEGSEYNKYSQCGNKHTISADSSAITPTWGFKWKSKKENIPDLTSENGPLKYNGMFIDLSKGWEYLIYLEETWDDDYVMETSKNQRFENKVKRNRSNLILPNGGTSPVVMIKKYEEEFHRLEMSQKISNFENGIENMNTKIENLMNVVEKLNSKEDEKNHLKDEMNNIRLDIEELRVEISQIKCDLTSQINSYSTNAFEQTIKDLKEKMGKMTKKEETYDKKELKDLKSKANEIEILKKNIEEIH
eukprot:gene7979-12444_t